MRHIMSAACLCLLLCAPAGMLRAQRKTDFTVTAGKDGWNIVHRVEKGETVFMLARRYHVPPAILADANGVSYNDGLKEGAAIVVPLGAYNMQTSKPVNVNDTRALYYKVLPEDNMYRISRHTSVSQRTLAEWNNMKEPEVHAGQLLLVGWVLYDATQVNAPAAAAPAAGAAQPRPARIFQTLPAPRDTPKYVLHGGATPPVAVDTAAAADTAKPDVPPIEALFREQTQDGQNVVWEKGSAAFFSLNSRAAGADVFAFHNKAAKGSVIRVKNINNGRVIFVKVLGPLPMTKQYYNAVIGLSGQAKAALGVREAKAFCELSYAGY